MKNLNIKLVKKLRIKTKISISKCKEALLYNNNNYKKSLKYLINKTPNFKNKCNNGFILTETYNNKSIIIKIKCESDFVSKNKNITKFAKNIILYIYKKNIISLEKLKKKFSSQEKYLSIKLGENIHISDFLYLTGKYTTNYTHNNKIGTILKIKKKTNKNISNKIKKISMHITALNPKFINKNDIDNKIKRKIKQKIYISTNLKKNNNLINKKILNNKINKKIKEITLMEQKFIFNDKMKIKKYLKKNKFYIKKFYRLEI